jgi:zinc transport system substrate-binding protein
VRRFPVSIGLAVMSLVAAGCGSMSASSPADGRPSVVVAFYPLQWVADRIGGADISVTSLTPAGAEPHDLELDAKRLETLQKADVVVYLGDDFQPEVQKAVEQLPSSVKKVDILQAPSIDLLPVPDTPEGSEKVEGSHDPHVWLDPVRMQAVATAVGGAMASADPARASTFIANQQKVVDDLGALNTTITTSLASCQSRTIVTGHAAFQYFSQRYHLVQMPIAGVSPEEEPDPKTLENISKAAKSAGATTVYFEDALPSRLASTVASEIGAKTDLLSALEFDPSKETAGADYISVQKDNTNRLVGGLGCSGA